MIFNYIRKTILVLIAIIWRQVYCVGQIKSWQTFQNYGNRDLFNQFTIVFQLDHSLISTDIIKLRVPFSIGDLRQYPQISWYEISETTCVFNYLPNKLNAVQVDYIGQIFEYSLAFADPSQFMSNTTWYQIQVQTGTVIPSSITDLVIKIGMSTYSGMSETTSVLYDQNLELISIYIQPNVTNTLILPLTGQFFNTQVLQTNRVRLTIKQHIVEAQGRFLINLSSPQFSFAAKSVCNSIDDSSQSNVVVMQPSSFTCNITSTSLEIVYYGQPLMSQRIFVFQFDILNSMAQDSLALIVYQMEVYSNLVLDSGTINLYQTQTVTLTQYDLFLSFGQRPSSVFQLYSSLPDYNVYNTLTLKFQTQINTPDTLSQIVIELGTKYFSVLQGSIYENLPNYNPSIQTNCQSIGSQIICTGVGSLQSQTVYQISFKLLINYSYSINVVPSSFLNFAMIQSSSGSYIIKNAGIQLGQIQKNIPKITSTNTFAASFDSQTMPQYTDGLGYLKQLQTNPYSITTQVIGFMILDDGTAVLQDNQVNKGYVIYTTPMIQGNGQQQTCLSRPNSSFSSCIVSAQSDMTTFRFIGTKDPFQPQSVQQQSVVFFVSNLQIMNFGQMGGQEVFDFYVQTFSTNLQANSQDSSYLVQSYLVNTYVYSEVIVANVNVMAEIINYLGPNPAMNIDGYNTISFLKINTNLNAQDPMMSSNFDYPLRVEIFFDNMQVLPLYSNSQIANITDPYEMNRISCIGAGISCYYIPTTVYYNPQNYNFITLNRIQIQFQDVNTMVQYNNQYILIPFTPIKSIKFINMFLALSQGVKALSLKKPSPYYRQINQKITFNFRDASSDNSIKYNNYNNVNYNLQSTNIGQILNKFQINFSYQSTDPIPNLSNPKYIIYNTLWNFTNNFIPSQQVSSFLATVQDDIDLTCSQFSYVITGLNYFGLLCPLIMPNKTTPNFQNTYISMLNIQIPYVYGIQLPRSSVSISDSSGNLRSFSFLNSRNRLNPGQFTFLSISPKQIIELQKGMEINFSVQTTNLLPPNFIFVAQCTDSESTLNFAPVIVKNGCIINENVYIFSTLTITPTAITCVFQNSDYIPQGNIEILVVSIQVLQEPLNSSNQVEYTKTLVAKFYTSGYVLILKSDRGRKLLYQRQRQYGDSNSQITLDEINIKQIRQDNYQISFQLNFVQKDWDDFENLQCDFTSLLKSSPTSIDCELFDYTNNKQNFVSQCYFNNFNLLVIRNLDITLYPVSQSYSYFIQIGNLNANQIYLQNQLPNTQFTCSTVEPGSKIVVLQFSAPIQSLQLNYQLINISPNGPNGDMKLKKLYSYPGLTGQLQLSFNTNQNQITWKQNTMLQLSFPSRYISGLGNRDHLSCYQNKVYIPCIVQQQRIIQIQSLAQDSLPNQIIIDIIGLQEPSSPLILDNSGNPTEMFELLVIDGGSNSTISYYNEYDIAVSKNTLSKVRFLNSTSTQNQTYLTSDFYNFTFMFPQNTPQKTKMILEFPNSFVNTLNYYQPDSCILSAPNLADVTLDCIAQSNRISITSEISNDFVLSSGIIYTLQLKGLKNPFQASRCNSEKLNILVFDDSNNQLVMLSGESQSAARNITLTSDTTLNTFNISTTRIDLVYGVISEEITIFINQNVRSQSLVEFNNNFLPFVSFIPSTPSIPIGEYQTTFRMKITNSTIVGQFNLFISQFSTTSTQTIKDVPPVTINIINQQDKQSIQSLFSIKLPFTHFQIPVGGFSLPLVVSLDKFLPSSNLIFSSTVVNLPQNGVSIYRGGIMNLTANFPSSYLQLSSDSSISQVGSLGVVQINLQGENANSFFLVDNILTFEVVQAEQQGVGTSSADLINDLQIFINPTTLSPVNQIIQVLSSQSLTLYYAISSNFTQFNSISLKSIIQNLQSGIVEDFNQLNQRQSQYGFWTYQGNSGLQDYYINNLYENTQYLIKVFPLNNQGQFLGQNVGNFTTSSNSGQLLKTIFRFQSTVSIAQQIDFACKMSQYFAINQLYLTSTTGVRCDSPSNIVNVKTQTGQIQIQALDNPNPQYITLYFSYNKGDAYNSYNSQIYNQLINQKSTIISWYTKLIQNNRFFQQLIDFQASTVTIAQALINTSSIKSIESKQWISVQNIYLNNNGYVWIMIDKAGNFPPDYLQIRQNLNCNNQTALANYVSQYNSITNKQISFNITGLASQTKYDIFLAITSDDSSDNMTYQPQIFTITLSTI
ncbi:HMG box protein (macronuclear) [Tetrahymena thermophila SB210]|uniref:HMG box protein n=1 Tax=Tetrahymena thermophila (strain SB210) TaxID=312017 RepID=Q231L8_TETTS|nr:HMG box protein [Tetrahymena thermophila SB210]EAR91284.3 HMG box protein [Tetrahymena thermophila SB210]|eukprot:XP_001011529.3 HMG box protein [Tetrahymena thermophila SB210]